MLSRYDVIIVGAGPGGLECARHLKDSRLSVLLIEKNEVIGPKPCAGGLTELFSRIELPEGKVTSSTEQEVIAGNKRYLIKLDAPLKTVSQEDLGQHQLSQIKDARNIDILKGVFAKEIKDNKVITSKGVFSFRYLVGADGSYSRVRAFLGLESKFCFGLFYRLEDVVKRFVWCGNPKKIKSSYIWIFPHKDHSNAGIYFDPAYLTFNQARSALEDFLRSRNYHFKPELLQGAPVNYLYKGCVFNNIFLVGDAAGLPSKGTGEGISFAVISGRDVAKKIILPDHEMRELNRALVFKKRQERMLEAFNSLPLLQPYLLRSFIRLMRTKKFQDYFGH